MTALASASAPGETAALARVGRAVALEHVPPEVSAVAKHCLLDWLGVALAGSREPLSEILAAELDASGSREATLFGRLDRVSALAAALMNGAAGHALDLDDTHLTMTGHPTAPVAPAVLALAERLDSSGADLLTAFIAGVEVECRLGALIGPSQYARGWHTTGTLGTFGAAAGCARLLSLDQRRWLHALGIAGTQASGLQAVFGTMCKPLHAGRAAANGLLSALLAARDFTSSSDIVEAYRGFGPSAEPRGAVEAVGDRWLIPQTLFKHHAACYLTHGVLDSALMLRNEHGIAADDVAAIDVLVAPGVLEVANVEEPRTGLEAKFSLRGLTAMALLGDDTADPAAYNDQRMASPDLVAMRDRVRVSAGKVRTTAGTVRLCTTDGRELVASVDASVPSANLGQQGERLRKKFDVLAGPIVGNDRAGAIAEMVGCLDELQRVTELTRACAA